MSSPHEGGPYTVHCSTAIGAKLKELQRKGDAIGIGHLILSAIKQIERRLSNEPSTCGEPLYRLPALKLQVRIAFVPPLVVHYAIHEERPLVFIKGIEALPGQGL